MAASDILGSVGNFLTTNSGPIGSLLQTGSQLYGQQNAGEAISKSANAGIGVANTTMGNISSLYKPQTTLGNAAMTTLGSSLGVNGQPANYNNFLNMPGYKFAVDQGTQAIQRQAAAMGSAYTPNTAQAVGQYVTGTAMQDYNTYVNQLIQAGQFGQNANSVLANSNLRTAGNIEQLGLDSGMGQAGMYTGMGATLGGPGGGPNASGAYGGAGSSGVANLIGSGISMIGKWLGGSNSGSSNPGYSNQQFTNDPNIDPYSGLTNTQMSNLGNLDFSGGWGSSTNSDPSLGFNNVGSGFDGSSADPYSLGGSGF